MAIFPVNNNGFTQKNKVRIVHGGQDYFQTLLQLISIARETIHLQCYIYDDDDTGKQVAEALKAASLRGVSVYLIADGYASQVMSQPFIDELRQAGIRFRFFEPLFRSRNFYFGRRLHHKVFVVDSFYSLVGGVNISNHYNDLPSQRAWLDFALYAEGEVAKELCTLCWKTWHNFMPLAGKFSCIPAAGLSLNAWDEGCSIRLRRNDWVRRKNEISTGYINMLRGAEKKITICCSYFLPGNNIRRMLSQASRRGVKIQVIIAGPSDVMIAKSAERWMYDWLLRNNIELYEYQPSVLHAKVAVCDGRLVTVGSYNINKISAYASIELNLEVMNETIAAEMELKLAKIIARDCIQVTKETHLKRKNPLIQFMRWCSYQSIRLMFYVTTFYYKQK